MRCDIKKFKLENSDLMHDKIKKGIAKQMNAPSIAYKGMKHFACGVIQNSKFEHF